MALQMSMLSFVICFLICLLCFTNAYNLNNINNTTFISQANVEFDQLFIDSTNQHDQFAILDQNPLFTTQSTTPCNWYQILGTNGCTTLADIVAYEMSMTNEEENKPTQTITVRFIYNISNGHIPDYFQNFNHKQLDIITAAYGSAKEVYTTPFTYSVSQVWPERRVFESLHLYIAVNSNLKPVATSFEFENLVTGLVLQTYHDDLNFADHDYITVFPHFLEESKVTHWLLFNSSPPSIRFFVPSKVQNWCKSSPSPDTPESPCKCDDYSEKSIYYIGEISKKDGMPISHSCETKRNFGFFANGGDYLLFNSTDISITDKPADGTEQEYVPLPYGFAFWNVSGYSEQNNTILLTIPLLATQVDDSIWDETSIRINFYTQRIADGAPVLSHNSNDTFTCTKQFTQDWANSKVRDGSVELHQLQYSSIPQFLARCGMNQIKMLEMLPGKAAFSIEMSILNNNEETKKNWVTSILQLPPLTQQNCDNIIIPDNRVTNNQTLKFTELDGACQLSKHNDDDSGKDKSNVIYGTITFGPPPTNLTTPQIFALFTEQRIETLTKRLKTVIDALSQQYGLNYEIQVKLLQTVISYANTPLKRRVHITFRLSKVYNDTDDGDDGDQMGKFMIQQQMKKQKQNFVVDIQQESTLSLYDLWLSLQQQQGNILNDNDIDDEDGQFTTILGDVNNFEDPYDPQCRQNNNNNQQCAPNPIIPTSGPGGSINTHSNNGPICYSWSCSNNNIVSNTDRNMVLIGVVIAVVVVILFFVSIIISLYCCKKHQKACWAPKKSKKAMSSKYHTKDNSNNKDDLKSTTNTTNTAISMTTLTTAHSHHSATTTTTLSQINSVNSQVEIDDVLLSGTEWKAYQNTTNNNQPQTNKIFYVNQHTMQSTWKHPITGQGGNDDSW